SCRHGAHSDTDRDRPACCGKSDYRVHGHAHVPYWCERLRMSTVPDDGRDDGDDGRHVQTCSLRLPEPPPLCSSCRRSCGTADDNEWPTRPLHWRLTAR